MKKAIYYICVCIFTFFALFFFFIEEAEADRNLLETFVESNFWTHGKSA